VVVSGSGGDAWKEEELKASRRTGATVAFDAIAGQSTGDLLTYSPSKGTVNVYGGLQERSKMDPGVTYQERSLAILLSAWLNRVVRLQYVVSDDGSSESCKSQQRIEAGRLSSSHPRIQR
jgi:hypothetical protein